MFEELNEEMGRMTTIDAYVFRGFPKGKPPIVVAFIFFFKTSHFPISVKYPRMIRTTNEIRDGIFAFSFLVNSRFYS